MKYAVVAVNATTASAYKILCSNMTDFPVAVDEPRFNAVIMIETIWPCMQSADGDQLFPRRLHVTGFIGAPRLQCGFTAIPFPGERESRGRFRKHRLIESRVAPRFSIVG